MRNAYGRSMLGSVCSLIIAVTFVARSGAEIDTAHIVGAWLLDENTGDVTKDASGNGNDGKLLSGPGWDTGSFGSGLLFDGVDDAVQVPSDRGDELNPETQVTLAAWAQRLDEQESPGYMILGRMDTVDTRTYYLAFWMNKFQMEVSHDGTTGGRTVVETADPLADHEWHHLAGTYDGEEIVIYVDGARTIAGPAGAGIHQNDSDVYIGYDRVDGGFFFNGMIDEVIVLDVALSEGDVGILMDGLKTMLAVSPAGRLAARWAALKRGSH